MNWYSRYPILTHKKSLSSVLKELPSVTERIQATMETLEYVDTVEETSELVNKLPSWIKDDLIMRTWKDVVTKTIKTPWSVDKIKKIKGNGVEKRIVNATYPNIAITGNTVSYEDTDNVIWTFKHGSKAWVVMSAKERNEDIETVIAPYREKSMDEGINYFAILDKEYVDTGSLKIVESLNLRSMGRSCGTYPKPLILRLILQLDVKPLEELDSAVGNIRAVLKKNAPLMEAAGDLIKDASQEQLENLYWWSKTKKLQEKACPLIMEKFDGLGLLVRV